MTDSQVILFGSFTEDEAKALQNEVSDKYGTNSPAFSPKKGPDLTFKHQGLSPGPSLSSRLLNSQVVALTPKRISKEGQCSFAKGVSDPALGFFCSENGSSQSEKDSLYHTSTSGGESSHKPITENSTELPPEKVACYMHQDLPMQKEVTVEFHATKSVTSNGKKEDASMHGLEQTSVAVTHGQQSMNTHISSCSTIEKCQSEITTVGVENLMETSSGENKKETLPVTPNGGVVSPNILKEPLNSGGRLKPRGLMNTGNSCFLNATLQALLSCPPFWNLAQSLHISNLLQTSFPTLRALIEFVREFESVSPRENFPPKGGYEETKKDGIEIGRSFAPTMFEPVLRSFSPDTYGATRKNRQEDAQEFLSYLMDRMHEELLKLNLGGSKQNDAPKISDEDEWETVGPKNRTAITRVYKYHDSPLSEIFGGQIRSIVKSKGNKASATVQPFLLLHLEILPEAVHSLEDALKLFAAPELLEGYKSTGKAEVVTASKSVKIQTLPKILILHLMRFSYGVRGTGKVNKSMHFPLEFTLGRELLASPYGSGSENRKYELIATVTHHGKDHAMGHYTADAKQFDGRWLRFDDSTVASISLREVLHDQAYILFFKRGDVS